MKRMFVCGALQISYVTAYGMWAVLRPQSAFTWLVPFVATVWTLILYNNWSPIWRVLRHRRTG